jgi:sialate O-acetylesterase
MQKIGFIIGALFLLLACSSVEKNSHKRFSVAPIFSDYAVLQREKPNKIWGTGEYGSIVKVVFDGQVYQAKIDKFGNWCVETASLKAGGPYDLRLICDKDTLSFYDILVGDVWLCSGQSNMEFSVGNFSWKEEELQTATNCNIRFYTVPNTIDVIPNDKVPASSWKTAMGNDLLSLSATAYFFAKNIQPEINVPVGLIASDWSGTAAEPWMSKESLSGFLQFKEVLSELNSNTQSKEEIEQAFEQYRKNGWDSLYYLTGTGVEEKWYLPETDFSDWTPIKFPNYWEDAHVELDNFDGAVWFMTSFDLPSDFSGNSFHIFLDYVKDYNIAWVNGHKIGETYGNKSWSDYYAPAACLKPKGNILVVRVFNVEGKGGFNYHPLWESDILAGHWVCKADYAIDHNTFPKPKIVNVNPFSYPTVIYNAMIHPLRNYALTGFIWYQGESNAGRGYEYRTIFPALIQGWRHTFNQGDLPFYFVQLANFETPPEQPVASDWAELRESQMCALKLPATGMAVAIDIGEANDIHPKNKQEVGRRLALQALSKAYGKTIEAEAPCITNVVFKDNKALIAVQSPSPLQKSAGTKLVNGFALAGIDSVFYWADQVELEGDKIIVGSSKVVSPVAVRYAWAKNPGLLHLYSVKGLPLLPFRSDDWPGITDERVFNLGEVYF